jgi:glutamine amidotransferase
MSKMVIRICILDYGSGNVASVKNSFDRLKLKSIISNEIGDIQLATHLVLPGVGAFAAAIEKIEQMLPIDEIRSQIMQKKPFLGICVGMQAFAALGNEFEIHPGLGLIPKTEVIELPDNVSKPHVGWNSIEIHQSHPLFRGIAQGADFYFVHSYFVSGVPRSMVMASCEYGTKFPAVVASENLIGVQFHPEKSQHNGDLLLRNFTDLS